MALLRALSQDLLLSPASVAVIVRSAPRRYKVYTIPKRRPGEFRTIAQPAREVKRIQYWVMENVLRKLPVHPAARAYRQGANIADNASAHAGNAYLLKMDFATFFPSLRAQDLRFYWARNEVAFEGDLERLCKILFWKPRGEKGLRLSIGAPSSPLLSNILLYGFDSAVAAKCAEEEVAYTRYSDDLTFSCDRRGVLRRIEAMVGEVCDQIESPRLRVNKAKTVHSSRKHRRRVTGLILTNDGEVSLGRERKRELRAALHSFTLGRLDKAAQLKLAGWLAFAKGVEPSFLKRMEVRYGSEAIVRLIGRSAIGRGGSGGTSRD